MDLYKYTYDLVRQIPPGRVSTYGAVAEALGDIRASRAVGRMMNQNPNADTMPCFKIVHSDGHIGGFGLGKPDKIRRLEQDNIAVQEERIIDFNKVFFNAFQTTYPLKKLREQQLRSHVHIADEKKPIETIAGFDVAYPKNDWNASCGACVVTEYQTGKIIEQHVLFQKTLFPYIPTYLSFREAPFIKGLFDKLQQKPSVLMVDGHGILHPFHFGLACHVGTELQMPTIGVAKRKLGGSVDKRTQKVYVDGRHAGYAFSVSSKIKNPVYISPGHMISVDTAFKITKNLSKTKHPEPLRYAHQLATSSLSKIR
jgi:deoxyribonuclease V